jgi:hypothetical protein
MRKATPVKIDTASLPPGIKASDLVYDYKNSIPYGERPQNLPPELTFYLVRSSRANRGDYWVMTTLSINNRGRAYGIGIADKLMYSVGAGPHVIKTVRVYFTKTNMSRLQKYFDMYMEGAITANQIRDRRSTSIARTKARKADAMAWLGMF